MGIRFRTKVLLGGKTATGFEVPEKVVTALGTGKRPAVRVTINGFTYRSTIAPYGGKILLPLSAENREGAGIKAGDTVTVDVELDTAPREVRVPGDLAAALERGGLKKTFDALSFTRRREHVASIEGAKTEETRKRRVDKAIDSLRKGR